MKYICMVCGKIYNDKCLPIRTEGDGCCTIGSLIEVDYQKPKTLKEAYIAIQQRDITLSEFLKIITNMQ